MTNTTKTEETSTAPAASQPVQEETGVKSQFVERVVSLPVVSAALEYASNVYTNVKQSNPIATYTMTAAETASAFVMDQARPYVEKMESQVQIADHFACQGLDKVEETFPFITKPPQVILDDTKKLYESTVQTGKQKVEDVKALGVGTVTTVKNYGMEKVAEAMNSPYVQIVNTSLDRSLTITEKCVDYCLPPADDESKAIAKIQQEQSTENSSLKERTRKLSDKVRHRMHRQAMAQMQNLQKRSQETVAKLAYTVDLIQYARENLNSTQKIQEAVDKAKQKATWFWEELNKEEPTEESAKDATEKTTEQKMISLARRITSQLVQTYSTANSTIHTLPQTYHDSVAAAYQYAIDLYSQFEKVSKVEELTTPFLQGIRASMTSLELITHTILEKINIISSSEEAPIEMSDLSTTSSTEKPDDETTTVKTSEASETSQ